jgi:hypothetical protein
MSLRVCTSERFYNLDGVNRWIEVRLDTTTHILVALTLASIHDDRQDPSR